MKANERAVTFESNQWEADEEFVLALSTIEQALRFERDWKDLYFDHFTANEKEKTVISLEDSIGIKPNKVAGALIEDRVSQNIFSALGQKVPIEQKEKWDPDFSKRKSTMKILDPFIPEFSLHFGGTTSIDVTKPGVDKTHGIRKIRDIDGITIDPRIFVGNTLFKVGNDCPLRRLSG